MRALCRAAHERYLPSALVVPVAPAHQQELATLLPWIASLPAPNGRAAAYVCRGFTCQAPIQSAEELISRLADV
jgi:uncharacterized protein YyaL (SSP411 family)